MSGQEIAWSVEGEAALLRLLDAANGRRRGRVLTPEQVRACAEAALAAPEQYAWRSGGEVDDARAMTTVCLAVATPGGVTVGVAAAHAQGVTPARAWADLRAWERFHAPANVAGCVAWAARERGDRVRFGVREVGGGAPRLEEGLRRAVLAEPRDDGPRSVLADWWTERGEPRGELVALQLEREGLAPGEPRVQALLQREDELLEAHGARWLGPVAGVARARFRRGFVEEVTLVDADGFGALAELCEREPVTSLTIASRRRVDCLRLAQAPWLARLVALGFESDRGGSGWLGRSGLEQLLTSRHLGTLESLRFLHQGLGDAGLDLLAMSGAAVLPRLRELSVERDRVTARGVAALVQTKWGAGLERLSLAHNELGPEGAEVLAGRRGEPRLRALNLDANRLGEPGAVALARSPRLAGLRHLSLEGNGIPRAGLDALLGSPHLRRLESLGLGGNWLGEAGRTLLASRFPGPRPRPRT
jgi:uncharacterized protein (TIGR02996 family)